MSRVIMVSNRLPVTVKREGRKLEVIPSAGGLASALRSQRHTPDDVWVGWPGSTGKLSEPMRVRLHDELLALNTFPIYLDDAEADLFYEGFANGFLWPLLHYVTGVLPLQVRGWEAYRRVNERFAESVAAQYRDGDVIWIHDYHLMLLPSLLRERLPRARIGFFLHTPFPSSEVYALLPHREELLRGLLGADVIGFHTSQYLRHFRSALRRLLGITVQRDSLEYQSRAVDLGVFPIGVDAIALQTAAQSGRVREELKRLRGDGGSLLVGIDRLDYTKGIPRRLLAVEELLKRYPEWHGQVRLIQISVPSREGVGAYQSFRGEVDSVVGRINGTYGTPHWMPIHYLYQTVTMDQLLALYRAANVMLVTPVRDGMNLVCKEFVATRSDEDGVLILSEFAGAAAELEEAVTVNPFDVERTADAIHGALTMLRSERRSRMRALRERVRTRDVRWWASSFLQAVESDRSFSPA